MNDDRLFRDLPDSFDPPPSAPAVAAPPPSTYSWSLASGTLVWLGGTLYALLFVVPKFVEVFAEVKIPMPGLTAALACVSWMVCRLPWVFGAFVLAFSAWTGIWEEKPRRIARRLIPLAILFTVGALILGLFMPMIGTLEGVGHRR